MNDINEKGLKLSSIDNRGLEILDEEINKSKTFLKSSISI